MTPKKKSKEFVRTTRHIQNRICILCSKSRPVTEMRYVPTNGDLLSEWINRLGPKFAQENQKQVSSVVCRTHMESQVKKSICFPKINWNEIIADEVEQIDENVDSDRMVVEYENYEVSNSAVENGQGNEEELQSVQEKEGEEEEKEKKWDVVEVIPPKEELIDRSQEVMDIMINKERIEAVEYLPDEHKNPHWTTLNNSQKRELGRNTVEMISPSNEVVHCSRESMDIPSSSIINVIMENNMVQCRKFGCHGDKNLMAEAPTDLKTMQTWFTHLGNEFLKNVCENLPPHYVCGRDMGELCAKMNE